jgi:protein gp37
MPKNTNIEWTDDTWNPIRGCSRVSEGCRNCYAEGIAYRFSGPGKPYEGLVTIGADGQRRQQWNGQIKFVESALLEPLRWKKPRRIFVNSMSDLFHANVTDEMRDRIFAAMALCPQHTFQVLTKRPERMLAYLRTGPHASVNLRETYIGMQVSKIHLERTGEPVSEWAGLPLPNVWLGVSVEDQKTADARIPYLLQTPAAIRYASYEPALGPVDFTAVRLPEWTGGLGAPPIHSLRPDVRQWEPGGSYMATKLDQIIMGGESGRNARPMHPDWARSTRNQCRDAGVAFFFKQWGEWARWEPQHPASDVKYMKADGTLHEDPVFAGATSAPVVRVGKKRAGHLLDGVEHFEFPAQIEAVKGVE